MTEIHLNIPETAGQTKVRQLVHSITEAVNMGKLKVGDVLPSVNKLSKESGFSRDTVFKAYSILKQQNVIESAPTKGYYVANESFRVFMLLDDFSAFKEQLYKSFRKNLPESYAVDLLFHHYNQEVFTQLVENSLGRYSMYIVMNIDHLGVHPILEKIDSNKLLILDMGYSKENKYNFLVQDFNKSVKGCLEQGLDELRKYRELVLVYNKKSTPHPEETTQAVRSFCKKNQIAFRLVNQVRDSDIQKEQAWFVIHDADLVNIIKSCRAKKLKLGIDVGILSYNDTPMKQIVGGGISVISTNFEQMGKLAADFIKKKQQIRKTLPTFLILRDSL